MSWICSCFWVTKLGLEMIQPRIGNQIFLSNLPILLATCINNTSYTLASWGKVDLLWIKKSYMYCVVYVYLDIHNLAFFVLGKWQVINPPGKTSEGNEHLPGTEHTCKFTLIDHIEMCSLHLLAQKYQGIFYRLSIWMLLEPYTKGEAL